jgi:hypothetical protein
MRRVFACAALLCAFVMLTPERAACQETADRYNVKIVVMGPGDEVYLLWGHLALIVEDRFSGRSSLFNYGIFSFDTENFILNFAMGRLWYSMGITPTGPALDFYKRMNRSVTLYTLDLPPDKKTEMLKYLEWNALPENNGYFYHHFRDNCVTRVIDQVDKALDGQFYARLGPAPGRFTLRGHVRRHTWFVPFWDWFLNFLLGQSIDEPVTVQQEMFLPSEVGAQIAAFVYTDSQGRERPLVSQVENYYEAVARPPVLDAPPRRWPAALALGLAVGLAVAAAAFLTRRHPLLRRRVLGLTQALLGLFWGIAGSLLLFMVVFTDHDYTRPNFNLLFANPLLLAAVPLGLTLAFAKKPATAHKAFTLARWLWRYVFIAAVCAILLKLIPSIHQDNWATLFLLMPASLAFATLATQKKEAG